MGLKEIDRCPQATSSSLWADALKRRRAGREAALQVGDQIVDALKSDADAVHLVLDTQALADARRLAVALADRQQQAFVAAPAHADREVGQRVDEGVLRGVRRGRVEGDREQT